MTYKTILADCDKAEKALEKYKVSAAIALLRDAARAASDHAALDRLGTIEETYGFMSRYLIEGIPDDSRMDVYAAVIADLRKCARKLRRDAMTEDSSSPYFETLRLQKIRKEDFGSILESYFSLHDKLSLAALTDMDDSASVADRRSMEEAEASLFGLVWTSLGDKQMYRRIMELAEDAEFGVSLAVLLANALILAILEYYDSDKMSLLFDIYDSENTSDALKARAMTGIVFALMRHPQDVSTDKAATSRLSLWQDSIMEYSRLKHFTREMMSTRDTERISKKMMNEVIPEIMKLKPEITEHLRKLGDDPESVSIEDNPEWEEMLEKTGLGKKMRELADMQTEGADMLMPAMATMKQFPFFASVPNWFLPFRTDHSILSGRDEERRMIGNMETFSAMMCDSDKYSLVLAMGRMSEQQRNMMSAQLDAQMSQLTEEMKTSLRGATDSRFNREVTKTLRGLYRFFRLFRKKESFYDPFGAPFNFIGLPVIGEMLNDREIVELAAEFYFKRGYYAEALPMFGSLVKNDAESEDDRDNDTSASCWEKIGFSRQQTGDSSGALEAYTKAELLKEPGIWLLKRLAAMHKGAGDYEKAAGYYRRLLETDSENTSLLMNAGFCELNLGKYKDALAFYHHAYYLKPDSIKILRAIAWTEFMNRDFDKSLYYYDRILDLQPTPADHLNRGHVLMLAGDYRNALDSYRLSAAADRAAFDKAFAPDLPTLESLGLDTRIAAIILDALTDR